MPSPFKTLKFLLIFFFFFFFKSTWANNVKGNGTGFSLEVHHVQNVLSQLSIANLREEQRNWSTDAQQHGNSHRKLLQFRPTMKGLTLQHVHLVKIWIGTPPTLHHLMLDTGSALTWIQCPRDEILNLRRSKTYTEVSCTSPLCKPPFFNCINGKCMYEATYLDRSVTRGVLSTDTFSSKPTQDDASTTIRNVPFGCSYETEGILHFHYDGILGMDTGIISFASHHSRTFSYCLPRSDGEISFLRFGSDIPNNKPRTQVFSTPIIQIPGVHHTEYFLKLLDISVDGQRLELPSGTFDLRSDGRGGCFIDTGFSFTTLIKPVYDALTLRFTSYFDQQGFVRALQWMKSMMRLDVCYIRKEWFTVRHTMVFHFEGADFVIGTRDIFMMNDDLGVFCLAMRSSKDFTVIGNYQQRDKRFIYNVERSGLEFYPENCSLDSSS